MQNKNNQAVRMLSRLKARVQAKFRAGVRDERGAAAVFFAVGLVLLAPAALGLVDVYLTTTQRAELQDALDTATLYAARSNKMTDAELKTIGEAALLANLKLPDGQELVSSTFTLDPLDKITVHGMAQVTPPGIGPQLWTRANLQADSEVLRNSNNVEVAMVLDITGSMAGEMENLKTAAKDLVDLVIKEQQDPFYTKIALIPYSVGVNLGAYAERSRGATIPATAITGMTNARPVVVTSVRHGLATGEHVWLTDVTGMKNGRDNAVNGKDFVVTKLTDDTFSLKSGGSAFDGRSLSQYSSGGAAHCTRAGCTYYNFINADEDPKTLKGSDCATERIGDQAYTDVSATTALVGRHYGGNCPDQSIIPLTIQKDVLKNAITGLTAKGGTAGQIGLGWGWYMISPQWGDLWTSDENKPAAYDKAQLLKVVILMTDGAFNSPYCNNVVASDAGPSSGADSEHINCLATNGDPFVQAEKLCRNIKAKGVVIYTVGFNVGSDAKVKKLMADCATSAEYAYMPAGGAQLKVAFRAIAQDINSLRISK